MILVINAGSSSLKTELFDRDLAPILAADLTGIGGAGRFRVGGDSHAVRTGSHAEALDIVLTGIEMAGHPLHRLDAAAHRVVHGGARLTAPARLTADILAEIAACIPLAPLHNPHNLAPVRALADKMPDLPQFASFDTAFHATNPEVATTYALPTEWRQKGIRRYGFHGLSYAGMVEHFGPDLPRRLLAFHLGNGASLCAIRDGRSVATSMGYSPLEGLTMGTRTGSIDGMAVLRIAEEAGIDAAAAILNRESGLRGLAGSNDMRDLLADDGPAACFAVEHFCHWAARHGGSAIVAMGGVDAVAFTGGIGENAPEIRDRIMAQLAFLGPLPVHVVPAEEERQIARDALRLLERPLR